uniref:Leucine rich immune protein (Coil-less) n=1 Tax=Anopheles christyi TaxID=43041 RepID=A0A182JXE1_9DIPT
MAIHRSVSLVLCVTSMFAMGMSSSNFAYVNGNLSCTIVNVTSESKLEDYSFLTNNTEELIFDKATIDVLDLTKPLSIINPWKVLINNSNVTRILFPASMSPSVVHLTNMGVENVQFEENTILQDFRTDYTSLQVVSPTVSKLQALDILWITHSQLTNFSFDVLESSPISLLYLIGNRIEVVMISPGMMCCRNLEEIFLSGNQLKHLDFGTMAQMSKLKTLFLEDNKLTDLQLSLSGKDQNHLTVAGNGETFCSWRAFYNEQELNNQEVQSPNCTDFFATLLA